MPSAPNLRVAGVPGPRVRAVLVDAMGTLVRLEPPVPLLARALAAAGYPNDNATVAIAMGEEIRFYRSNHLRGNTPEALASLRLACASVLRDALDVAPPVRELAELLVASLRFAPFDDAFGLLDLCRAREIRTAVVSNWDCSLGSHLATMGLRDRVDAVVVSAEVGIAKPDPRIFSEALERLGVPPEAAIHCGDDPRRDLVGATTAGIRGVLLDRHGRYPHLTPRVRSLADVAGWI